MLHTIISYFCLFSVDDFSKENINDNDDDDDGINSSPNKSTWLTKQ